MPSWLTRLRKKEDVGNDLGHKLGTLLINERACSWCPDGQHSFHRATLLILLSLQYVVMFASASSWELTT